MFCPENYMDLCRLCATYQTSKMEIFGTEGRHKNIVEKIEICLPFKVSENDLLPKNLCYRCMYLLDSFYNFRKKCIHSVTMLENCISDLHGGEVEPELKEELEQMKSKVLDGVKKENNYDIYDSKQLHSYVNDNLMSKNIKFTSTPIKAMTKFENDLMKIEDDMFEEDMESEEYLDSPVDSKDEFEFHESSSVLSDQQTHSCKICKKDFYSLGRLNLHLKMHSQGDSCVNVVSPSIRGVPQSVIRPFSCDLCDKSYSLSKHLWGHVNTCHKGDPAVTCPVCYRVSSSCANLEEHKRTKHGLGDSNDALQSTETHETKTLPDLIDLSTKHPRIDLKIPSVPLNNCVSFASKSSSNDVRPHVNDGCKHTCMTCTSVFKSELELKKHMLSTQCLSYRKMDIRKNIVTETSLLKQTLLKSKPESLGLNMRKRTFSEIDSETEDIELVPLSDKMLLPKHEPVPHDFTSGNRRKNSKPRKIARSRSGESNVYEDEYETAYRCEICTEVYGNEILLAEHMTIHGTYDESTDNSPAVEKPFTCLLCDKKFSVRQALSRHFHACHGIDPSEVLDVFTPNKSNDTAPEYSRKPLDEEIKFEDMSLDDFLPPDERDSKHFYSCEVCIREFNDRSSLWLHMLYAHKEQAAFACGICLKVCGNNVDLKTHWKEHEISDPRRYLCQICGRQHDSRKKLISHIGIHSLDDGEGGYFDPEALILQNQGNPSTDVKDNSHADSDGFGENFSCELCFKTFPSEEGLIKHKKNSHKLDNLNNSLLRGNYQLFFVCELCGSSHQTKSDRWRHVFKTHANESVLSCDRPTCGKVFTTRALRHEHCLHHHEQQGDYPNTCEVCGKLWGSRVDFWKHMMGVHPDMVALTCGVCLKVLCDVTELADHVRANHYPLKHPSKDGEFACDICGRGYSNHSKMLRHRIIHDPNLGMFSRANYNFKMPDMKSKTLQNKNSPKVSKASATALSADLNIPVVPQEEPLACSSCPDLKFTELSELASHKRNVHCLYPCDLCTKCYGRSTHLWSHVNRKHKDHPELTCPVCSKLCGSKGGVTTHIAKLHTPKEKPVKTKLTKPSTEYTCSVCSKVFYKRTVYRKHFKTCRNKVSSKKSKGEYNLQCELCPDVVLSSRIEVISHIREKHEGHPDFFCVVENCSRVLRSKKDLEDHVKMHRSWKHVPTCDLCGETYDSKTKLWKHLYISHTRSKLMGLCGICFKNLPSEVELIPHVNAMHPGVYEKLNACRVCAKTYSSSYKAWQHINKCHTYKACRVCLHVFPDMSGLTNHLKESHDKDEDEIEDTDDVGEQDDNDKVEDSTLQQESDTACDNTEESSQLESTNVYDFEDDLEVILPRPKRSYECDMCNQIFPVPSLLADHKKDVHSTPKNELKPFQCEVCNKYFTNRTCYWKHVNSPAHKTALAANERSCKTDDEASSSEIHNEKDASPHCEDESELAASNSEDLTGDNSEATDSLYESGHFTRRGNFEDGSGVKPQRRRSDVRRVYVDEETGPCYCTVCGKEWSAMRHLWQHLIRNHRMNAAVTCGVCLEVCSNYIELSQHLGRQHPSNFLGDGNNFTCRICGRYHNARSKLLQHVTIHIVLGPEPENHPPTLLDNKNINSSNFCTGCRLVFVSKDALKNHMCLFEKHEQSPNKVNAKEIKETTDSVTCENDSEVSAYTDSDSSLTLQRTSSKKSKVKSTNSLLEKNQRSDYGINKNDKSLKGKNLVKSESKSPSKGSSEKDKIVKYNSVSSPNEKEDTSNDSDEFPLVKMLPTSSSKSASPKENLYSSVSHSSEAVNKHDNLSLEYISRVQENGNLLISQRERPD